MKTAALTQFGPPSVLKTMELPIPVPASGELLIRIEAAGVNRLDHYIREGSINSELAFPHILGSDAVGIIEDAADDVTFFHKGDRVMPMPGYPTDPADEGNDILSLSQSYAIRGLVENGSYAEFMTIPAKWALPAPGDVRSEELATLPMALVTAVRAVKAVGNVVSGNKVLIHAGASGTGSFMIQVAKAIGASVATTLRSSAKSDFVKHLGADLVLDMNDDTWPNMLKDWSQGGVDVAIDNLGGPSLARSVDATKPLGLTVLMGNVLGLESILPVRNLFFPQKRIAGTLMGGIDDLRWGLDQVSKGNIRPTLDHIYALDEAAAAHTRLAKGDAIGNIVLKVN